MFKPNIGWCYREGNGIIVHDWEVEHHGFSGIKEVFRTKRTIWFLDMKSYDNWMKLIGAM